jgi:hypothetical protein
MKMAKAVTDPPAGYVVLESFVVMVGGAPVVYAKGSTVEPGHPALKLYPAKFGPLTFSIQAPHRASVKPEVRAD